jgi:hypothetical protein
MINKFIFGLLLFIGSFYLLAWNEGRTIKRENFLVSMSKKVTIASADNMDVTNDTKLINLS